LFSGLLESGPASNEKERQGLFVRFLGENALHQRLRHYLLTTLLCFACAGYLAAQTPSSASQAMALTVKGAVKQELHLTLVDLKAMPHTKVTAKGHDGSSHEYEGITLQSLLAKAGVPQSGDLRGKNMIRYVVAEAADHYRAVFSLAELDADFAGESVLVADAVDSKDPGPDQGPLRLVVPGDKRQGRWVRMLKSIVVATASD
jgi:DMSO/TMAO reductase YedYZ molybdopterin-dependent catalytic subunit